MRKVSKARLFWDAKARCWVYFSSWVRGDHDRKAEAFCSRLNRLN